MDEEDRAAAYVTMATLAAGATVAQTQTNSVNSATKVSETMKSTHPTFPLIAVQSHAALSRPSLSQYWSLVAMETMHIGHFVSCNCACRVRVSSGLICSTSTFVKL